MTPGERADDILRRCWWREEDHPGEARPPFAGLDEEIAEAIRAAVAEDREAILRTLKVVRDEHSATHEEACGVQHAIDRIHARGKEIGGLAVGQPFRAGAVGRTGAGDVR